MARKKIDNNIRHRLKLLKREFEDTFKDDTKKEGVKLESYADYRNAAVGIEEKGKGKISTDTLINMWQKEPKHYPYTSKLNVIVRAMGYKDWDSYCEIKDRNTTLHSFFDPRHYKVEDLQIGDEITVGWYPQYYASLKYLGEYRFEILSCARTFKRNAGDVIVAQGFGLRYNYHMEKVSDNKGNSIDVEGYPLFPSITFRSGQMPENYAEIESYGFHVQY